MSSVDERRVAAGARSHTCNIDAGLMEGAIKSRTRAIMPVSL
ncbi:MAG TPA: hypothetical protein VM164_02020 [Burkholderiales bacterium]|nr:hypothetical protein [Burkholderiales bacterium]